MVLDALGVEGTPEIRKKVAEGKAKLGLPGGAKLPYSTAPEEVPQLAER